jgi:hypothetical protein
VNYLRERLANRVQLTTDGYRPYLGAVEGAFGEDIDYAQFIKLYGKTGGAAPEVRYSQPVCTGIVKRAVAGSPDLKEASRSYVERMNFSIRMQNRRFTRLTNALSRSSTTTFTRWRSTSRSITSAASTRRCA